MSRLLKRWLQAGAAFLFTLLAVLVILYWRISHPRMEKLSLPESLISLESPGGAQLLDESTARHDYDVLQRNLQTQAKTSWCGVASAVTVLNSLRTAASLQQTEFFNDCTDAVRSELRTTFGGMPLESFGRLVACHDAEVNVVHADASSLEAFRAQMQLDLNSSEGFVVVNYQRDRLGQGEGGHLSPLAAYHATSDRFLVLDVASYKYPPVWVKAEDLWSAMDTVDDDGGQRRGYALIRNRPQ